MQDVLSMRSSALFRRRLWRLSGQERRLFWPQLSTSCVGTSGGPGCQRRLRHLSYSQVEFLGAQLGVGRGRSGGGRSNQGVPLTPGTRLSHEQRAGGLSWKTTGKRLLWPNHGGGGWGGPTL